MERGDFLARARELAPELSASAEEHDSSDTFVVENYKLLKETGLFAAHVPTQFGGGGASHAEMCDVIRELAHSCSSTALAFSMHTHLVAAATWRSDHGDNGADGLLRRTGGEGLILASSGGSDWVQSSGQVIKDGEGYRFTGRKVFSSGSPMADLLVTSAILNDAPNEATVLHFPISLRQEGVSVLDNWRALGMRGTGSNDVVIENVFVPDAAIGGRRPLSKWGPFHLVSMVAFPLIYSVYVGVAEAARDLALERAQKRKDQRETQLSVGEMENELCTAQEMLGTMIAVTAEATPGPETTNKIMIRRTLVGRAALRTVEKAMEVVGGESFYRSNRLERLFRDVQGARFHPLTEKRQLEYTGRLLLGLSDA